jgi:hypothetical protein
MENNQSALADQAKAERDLAAAALLVSSCSTLFDL